jgi:hypothetical protein
MDGSVTICATTNIFEIPVYRCAKEAYYTEMHAKTVEHMEALQSKTGITREIAPDSFRSNEEFFWARFGGPWDFNEVVGWVRLYAEPSSIGAQLWWVNKRIQRRMRKVFRLTSESNILGTDFSPKDDSRTIFTKTLAQIESLGTQKPLKGRHLDLRAFRDIGPFVDWRALLDAAATR